jgi:hypothetical protein
MSKPRKSTSSPRPRRLTEAQHRRIAERVMAVAEFRNEMRMRNVEREHLARAHSPIRRIGRDVANLAMLVVLVSVIGGVVIMQAMAGG